MELKAWFHASTLMIEQLVKQRTYVWLGLCLKSSFSSNENILLTLLINPSDLHFSLINIMLFCRVLFARRSKQLNSTSLSHVALLMYLIYF